MRVSRSASSSRERDAASTGLPGAGDVLDGAGISAALLGALEEFVGNGTTYAEPLTGLDSSYGPRAFAFRLAGSQLPAEWAGPLQVRVAAPRASDAGLGSEAAVLSFCVTHGYRVPGVRALVHFGGEADQRAGLVTTRPTGRGMVEMIGVAPETTGELFGRLAERQAALHALPIDGTDLPVRRVEDIDRIGTPSDSEERAWLHAHAPALDYAPVLCHGGFHPMVVSGDDEGNLTVRNWHDAVRADPEYDVGKSLLVLWSAPFYTVTRTERAGLKMIRDMLGNMYRGAYEKQRPLDWSRVRYWQAYHAVRGMGQADTPADLVPALRKHFRHLVAG